MPAEPAPVTKDPSKKAVRKKSAPASKPAPDPAPEEPAPASPAPEAKPAEAAPAPEAGHKSAPTPESAPAAEAATAPAPPAEAPAAPAVEEPITPAQPEAPADDAPAVKQPAATDVAPAELKPAQAAPATEEHAAAPAPDAVPVPTPEGAAAPSVAENEKPADAATAAAEEPAAPAAPEAEKTPPPPQSQRRPLLLLPQKLPLTLPLLLLLQKTSLPRLKLRRRRPLLKHKLLKLLLPRNPQQRNPSPQAPPSAVPTSEPLNLAIEDVNDCSITIRWRPPETIGDSGLDGYTVECRKDQTSDWVAVNEKLTEDNRMVIDNLTNGDLLYIRVLAVNAGGPSTPAVLPEPIKVTEIKERPKILLPRSLKSKIVKKSGEQVNLVIPFKGKPKPLVSWTKDGKPLDAKTVNIRNSDKDSILFIRRVGGEHSGKYEVSVKLESLEDKASITIQVIDLPGPPTSMTVVDSWGFNAALEWTPPTETGNTEITGYTVQKSDKRTGEWFTIREHFHHLNATITDLVMGNSYRFRVFAENKCGTSKEAAVADAVVTVPKTGIVYVPPAYPQHDFSEAPKFTTPLSDRAATVGYTTKLLCAVRGSPKPKIEWLKNQMIIRDDPKFRQMSNQGVCSLEIRKPCCFDGGIYTCRAVNAYGEATVACKLEVKQVTFPEAAKGKK
ncbi:hypothetical protein GJAV_G00192940 [Gymnothorax javanicus]|nr:hypothetical protein GJAV_G00192940 [Gymnothorax javanicus]